MSDIFSHAMMMLSPGDGIMIFKTHIIVGGRSMRKASYVCNNCCVLILLTRVDLTTCDGVDLVKPFHA